MPSTTPKQARFMAVAAHNPAIAKARGISQSVAREFNQADAGTGILRRKPLTHKKGFDRHVPKPVTAFGK